MHTLYNIAISIAEKILPVTGLFSAKMKLFTEGRKTVFSTLADTISVDDKNIWIHAASLGEYEQAVPIIKRLRESFPSSKIVLTFFSPSGYEIKKNSSLADVVTYLPLDTRENAKSFLNVVKPKLALFIKYEFWPNFLLELKNREIRTLLVSGSFRKDQVFFKSYGKWMRPYLTTFEHFFLQNEESQALLASIGLENSTVSGDTRFDRVAQQLLQDNTLEFVENFKNNQLCIVAGSTWPEDEELLLPYINSSKDTKFIIAPHRVKTEAIEQLQRRIKKESILFSGKENKDLFSYDVLIIDTIGLLSRIYSYADIAYVGGAAGDTGLHNILEPATFGIPVVIGKNHSKFPEAAQLLQQGGLFSVSSKKELSSILGELTKNLDLRKEAGKLSGNFIAKNKGATSSILDYILKVS